MLKARVAKENVVRMSNEIGGLDSMATLIAEKGANILAVTAWVEGAESVFRLLSDNDVRVADALRTRGYEVSQADVLVVEMPHKPGMLHRVVVEPLAREQIDMHHLYATATSSQEQCLVVLSTANNDRAIVLLNKFHAGA